MSWGLEDVRVSRGRNVALAGVTVPVEPSRITVVVGGDGAGKSTCLEVLVGLLEPDAGIVRRPAKERIGYVPATAGLYADLTVAGESRLLRRRLPALRPRAQPKDRPDRRADRAGRRAPPARRAAVRRDAAQAGRRAGPAALTRAAGPRRADHRSRSGEPRGAVAAHLRVRGGRHRRRGHHDLRERGGPRGLRCPAGRPGRCWRAARRRTSCTESRARSAPARGPTAPPPCPGGAAPAGGYGLRRAGFRTACGQCSPTSKTPSSSPRSPAKPGR